MRPRNQLFALALDYLYREGKVNDQKELAQLTGINEVTISRILNDRVKQPSEETLRKLNAAFGGFFNMAWFRGESDQMESVSPEKVNTDKHELTPQPIDHSSLVNAALAAKDETIAALRAQITILEGIIKNKDEVIAMLRRSYQPSDLPAAAEN